MSKGSSQPAGQTAVTNPVQVAQQPYLNYGWGEAQNLYKTQPQTYYPGQTLAPYIAPNSSQRQGYENQFSTGSWLDEGLRPGANAIFGQAAGGGMSGAANPANPYYQGYAQGTSPVSQNYQALASQAQQGGQQYAGQIGSYATPMAQYGYQAGANNNLGLSQLGRTASGEYLNSNPYMAQMVQSAMDPVTRNYQTAIAPGLESAAALSGRYGSGAQANQASTAQQNLTRGLSDLSGNLYGQQYARERQAQDAAAGQYGQLYNAGIGLGMQGMQNAAGILGQAGNQFWEGQRAALGAANQQAAANQYGITGLGSGFNQGNQNALEAMRQYPGLAQAQLIGPQAQIQAGQGLTGLDQTYRSFLQDQIDDERARFTGNQMAPYNTLNAYMQSVGDPQQGSTSTPYYRNQGAEVMSGLTGIAGLGRTLLAPMTGGLSKI